MNRVVTAQQHILHIILAMIGAGFAIGFSQPLLEVMLHKFHFDDWHITALGLIHSIGFLFIAPFLPMCLRHASQHMLLFLGLLFTGGVLLVVPMVDKSWLIFALRFIGGMAHAIVLIVGATTVNLLAKEENRGAIIGIFAAAFFGAEALSPALLDVLPYRPETLVIFIDVIMVISAVPLMMNKFPVSDFKTTVNVERSYILLSVPVIFILAIIHSYNTATFEDAFSVYAEQIGFSKSAASLLTSTILMGGVILIGLIGISLDRFGRRWILSGSIVSILVSYVVLYFEQPHINLSWPFLFLLGGAVLGLYIEGMEILGRQFKGANLIGAMTGFVIIATIGSILSSLFIGLGMDEWGAEAFPLMMLVSNAIFLAAYVWLRIYFVKKNKLKA